MFKYVADFETINDVNDCRVWLWGVVKIWDIETFEYGTTLESFLDYVEKNGGVYYFHNLKFDSEFIIGYLLKNGYTARKDTKKPDKKEISVLMSRMGQLYSVRYKTEKTSVKLLDSLKIFPNTGVAEIANQYGLDMKKGEIDYNKKRDIFYKPDSIEIDYVKRDVCIIAQALNFMFSAGMNKMTMASNALEEYKRYIMDKNFKKWFPVLNLKLDDYIRRSYFGGFVYLNPKYKNKIIKDVLIFDVNSLYPSIMRNNLLPFGYPKSFDGKYEYDIKYPLYIQTISCMFKLKDGCIPTIRLRHGWSNSLTDFLTESKEEQTLILTNIDIDLFFEHYTVTNVQYHGGLKFKGSETLMRDFIDHWNSVKEQATIAKNKPLRQQAKLVMNSLSGKFALNPRTYNKYPYLKENNALAYETDEVATERDPIYTAMSTFITAYGRANTIRSAQKNYDRYIYSDTDSLHLEGKEIPDNIECDKVKLGKWDLEKVCKKAKYLREKSYMYTDDVGDHVVCAGMPKDCAGQVTYENFKIGARYFGKLRPVHANGGIVLEEVDFTIRG